MKAAIQGNRFAAQALIGALFIMVVITMAMAYVLTRMNIQQKEVLWRLETQAAFHAAEAGIAHALSGLRSNSNWRLGASPLINELRDPVSDELMGFYSVEVAAVEGVRWGMESEYLTLAESHGQPPVLPDPQTERWVRSIGMDRLQHRERVLMVKVRMQSPTDFMVATMGDLNIRSGSQMGSDVLARDIYFQINDALPLSERGIRIEGEAIYLRNIYGDDHPNVEIRDGSRQGASLSFATLDLSYYRNIAQENDGDSAIFFATGDQTINLSALSEGVDLIYVSGTANISGTYNRSLTAVSEGDMYITGSINAFNDGSGNPLPQLGLMSAQDVIIPETYIGGGSGGGDLIIEAFVMADGQGDSAGIFYAQGANGQFDGTLTFRGAMTTRGRGQDSSESSVSLSAFKAREYLYNSDFLDNRTIPYMPLSVNLNSWRQVRLGQSFPPSCLYFLDDEEDRNICEN